MDQLDVRIITHLQEDGTATNAGIARQVGVSEETVRRRLKRLMADKFIKVVAVPDAVRMGYQSQVIIGLQVDADKVDAVADELATMDEVTWVSVTTGSFDIFAWATLKSSEALSHFLRKRVGLIVGVRKMETFINLASTKEEFGINMGAVTL
ncbi:MAG: AsnC family transcriptional regulator [Chloroflexi bacterium]|jgi:Lrp/AsnC family transcriptional regulator for asnA, asnC and gidA|nr:AsnC family transcriptional regulator [Chloroflexota bacterium]MDP6663460.1 Lrp/AsnC family transcriptional regulator [SAR202 cluster bacterium]MDP6798952.1 Lrp/AsnC family transcriptional regulator [SAR202 cluster bacterium]MQG58706.1 Lrp/AsnC family transcriptional regulator [SAR202 cluster bacterium]HAL49198.1 AsnC family transcriptional regulator [Dehalococcoidia bacterium]|tara:strand:+ start:2683 stop:3138 length:456 start_codon:yes stop_codon:yes gene_type:complete